LLANIPKRFPSALAISYKWLHEKGEKIPAIVAESYKTFFQNYKGHTAQKGQGRYEYVVELRTLFKFCRRLSASVAWIKYLPEPDLLMGEAALLTGCTTSLRLLFECKKYYSHEYFALIDYIMLQAKLAAKNVDGFV